MSSEARGRCLCGAVSFVARKVSEKVGACHCNMCRRWGGGPFVAINCGNEVEFDGTDDISVFDSSEWAERGFCKHCGTHLFYRLKQSGQNIIPAGLVDEGLSVTFNSQVFIDEKPDYYAFANDTRNLTGKEVFELYG